MPTHTCRNIIIFALCVLFFGLVSQSALALSVQNIRFGEYQDKTRMVIDLDQPAQFRTFMLDNPYRMVIDLPAFEWQAPNIQSPQNAGVTATRHGNLQPGISRIVFDLNRPISIQSAFSLPATAEKPHRLVIDFSTVTKSIFSQSKNAVYGDLDPDGGTKYSQIETHTAPPPAKTNTQKPLIIIDPGHGGVDPGAVGADGLYEKHIVLALAKELKKQLEDSGRYRVMLTREKDVFIKLRNRVKFARTHQGDLFISLHADSLENKSVHGSSIYTLSEKASDAQTAKLAARENKADLIAGIDLQSEDEEVANILMDLARRDTMNQSKFFANTVVTQFGSQSVHMLERPHRYAGFAVLKAPDIPSVLLEAGFMSNRNEAHKLNSEGHRRKIARALKGGVDQYFEQVAKNQRM